MLEIKLTGKEISMVELVKKLGSFQSFGTLSIMPRIIVCDKMKITMESEENLEDWDHEDAGGGVGDPHGEQHGGHHEAEHDHPGGSPKKAQH